MCRGSISSGAIPKRKPNSRRLSQPGYRWRNWQTIQYETAAPECEPSQFESEQNDLRRAINVKALVKTLWTCDRAAQELAKCLGTWSIGFQCAACAPAIFQYKIIRQLCKVSWTERMLDPINLVCLVLIELRRACKCYPFIDHLLLLAETEWHN